MNSDVAVDSDITAPEAGGSSLDCALRREECYLFEANCMLVGKIKVVSNACTKVEDRLREVLHDYLSERADVSLSWISVRQARSVRQVGRRTRLK